MTRPDAVQNVKSAIKVRHLLIPGGIEDSTTTEDHRQSGHQGHDGADLPSAEKLAAHPGSQKRLLFPKRQLIDNAVHKCVSAIVLERRIVLSNIAADVVCQTSDGTINADGTSVGLIAKRLAVSI